MKAAIVTVLMAIVVCAGMLVPGAAQAAPLEYVFFEIQASGKGVEADTDVNGPDPIEFTENKHTLASVPLYAVYHRESRVIYFAYYVKGSSAWGSVGYPVLETEKSVLPVQIFMFPFYIDFINGSSVPIFASGTMQIQYKEKGGAVQSARLKSVGMGYEQHFSKPTTGSTYRGGALKIKGKKIDQADVPAEVLTVFGF